MPFIRIALEKIVCHHPRNWTGNYDEFYIRVDTVAYPQDPRANAISTVKDGVYVPTRIEKVLFDAARR